jgi:uncharacterized protein
MNRQLPVLSKGRSAPPPPASVEPGTFKYEDRRFQNVALAIVKVTHRCNLDCEYCYEHIAPGADMDLSLFRRLVSKLIRSTQQESLSIVFHGGEPSIMSDRWLTEAVKFVRTEARIFGKSVRLGMQSNMLAISEKKFELIRDLDISLGVSMDGPADIPNAMRPLADRAALKYGLARKLGVRIGILLTINHSNWSRYRQIMAWLHKDLDVSSCKANPVTPVGMGRELPWLEPESIFAANKDILDYMIESNGAIVEDNMLRELRRFVDPARPAEERTLCNRQNCGAGSEVIGITPDGNILPCGRFGWDESEYYLGHLAGDGEQLDQNYTDLVRNFHAQVPETWYDCDNCDARKICSFGCQAFIVRSKRQANVDCLPTKMRFAYFQTKRKEIEGLVKQITAPQN